MRKGVTEQGRRGLTADYTAEAQRIAGQESQVRAVAVLQRQEGLAEGVDRSLTWARSAGEPR